MTRETERLSLERKVVVVFDICSSTSILEDLKQTDNLAEWRNFLIGIKNFLADEALKLNFEIYKFIGDGWILLFPDTLARVDLLDFLERVSTRFDINFEEIRRLLQRRLKSYGLAFGIDSGELVRVEMNKQIEYLGRPLNVAVRLEGATKGHADGSGFRALFSKHCYNSLESLNRAEEDTISLVLRNLNNDLLCDCIARRIL